MPAERRSRHKNQPSSTRTQYPMPWTRSSLILDSVSRDVSTATKVKPSQRQPQLRQRAETPDLEDDKEAEVRYKVAIDQGTFNSSISWDEFATGNGIDPYASEAMNDVAVRHGDHRISSDIQLVRDPDNTNGVPWRAQFGSDDNSGRAVQHNPIVARFSKLSLVDKHVHGLAESEQGLKHIHAELDRVISVLGPSGKVNIRSVFDENVRTYTVKSGKDLIIITLRYLLDLVKNDMRWARGLQPEEVEDKFRNKVDIGIAVPPTWSDLMIDEYRGFLREADFPETTTILGEALVACVFRINQIVRQKIRSAPGRNSQDVVKSLEKELTSRNYGAIDAGGGTADFALMELVAIQPYIKIVEVTPSTGSLCGCWSVNQSLRAFIEQNHKDTIQAVAQKSGESESMVLDSLISDFESAKRNIDFELTDTNRQLTAVFENETHRISLQKDEVDAAFQKWCSDVLNLMRKGLKESKAASGIDFSFLGGGSRSRRLQKYIGSAESEFAGLRTKFCEPTNTSPVSQGILLVMRDQDLMEQKIARHSFGIAINVLYDHDNLVHRAHRTKADPPTYPNKYGVDEFRKVLVWGGCEGKSLVGVSVEGDLFFDEYDGKSKKSFDNITFKQTLYSSKDPIVGQTSDVYNAKEAVRQGHARVVGDLRLNVGSCRNAGLKPVTREKGGDRYVKTEFRAEPVTSGLSTAWRFIIPKGGKFKSTKVGGPYPQDKFFVVDHSVTEMMEHHVAKQMKKGRMRPRAGPALNYSAMPQESESSDYEMTDVTEDEDESVMLSGRRR